MLAGSVSPGTEPTVMHDAGSTIVLDACHILGPLSSDWTLPMVSERAREHGLACVTVRNASHFGNAAFWARQIAEAGLVGIVMCNSHACKAPPGGVERLTGANSLAIALPSTDSHPFVVELDPGGAPADAAAAIAAMLVPGASAKGFGLAAAIDLLCGGLSEGALGPEVGAFDGNPAQPYGCAHLFMAIDPARFGIAGLGERVARYAARIRGARRAHGVARIYAPGDRERARRAESGDECLLAPELLARLKECGAKVGVQAEL
jgi:LDH2 family malate/lactate/ureidoglycolate dehydrogenase